jgi:RNA polymerase-interacting CarD/CdnL/TRCF family regulator
MSEPSASQLTLAIGDRVVYPNQGVCKVEAVDVKEVAGQKLTFVTMRREEDGAKVMVPQAKVATIGLRKVATSDEIAKLFEFLKSDSDKATLDWKQRARTNADRMAQGGILGLAEVVKGLQVLSELRPLPTKERELYDNARHLLISEIAASLGLAEVNAEDAIDIVLFPPGRERPKRTAAEFEKLVGDDEDLGELGDMDLGTDLDLPPEEEPPPPEETEEEAADEDDEVTKTAQRPALDDEDEATEPEALAAKTDAPVKRKRGRPPKPKPPVDENAPPPVPKKRGRPPKPKPEGAEAAPAVPKKRGRPPKKKPEGEG